MEQGAVRNGLGQVHRPAAVGIEMHAGGQQMAVSIKADLESREEWMPMAGEHHVLIAVPAHADGLAGAVCRQRRQCRRRGPLRLLAAEAAAHAEALDNDSVGGNVQQVGDERLDFGRVLSG